MVFQLLFVFRWDTTKIADDGEDGETMRSFVAHKALLSKELVVFIRKTTPLYREGAMFVL
jgi:hypothetical protein